MTALVTGADGFIGSHLTELLNKKGYKVKAIAQYNSFNNWGWLEDVPSNNKLEIISGDIRDPNFCRNIMKDVDIIFHLAALIAIPYSYIAPTSYIDTNIKGTLNICQAARDYNVKRIIHTSTSEVYGSAKYVPIDENHPLQAQSPYSASKIAADAIAMSYYYSFNLPVTIARPFNTYGPRQSARAIIPTIITQIASGSKLIRLGDLSPTRDFNYIEDTCNGFIAIAESDNTNGETINIGSNTEVSVSHSLKLIKELMNSDVEFKSEEKRFRPEKSEVIRLRCDNSKIIKLTGFKNEYDLRSGLLKTISWFSNPVNLVKYKANIYNV
jgi:NAD dependent epimerase/dehydratase